MEYFSLFLALIWWGILFISFNLDRSRYRNCAFLFMALIHTVPALVIMSGQYASKVMVAVLIIVTIALLIVPFFLIADGIVMFRREGHSLSNMLSLLLGIVIAIGEMATFLIIFQPVADGNERRLAWLISQLTVPAGIISYTVIYGSLSFLMFVLYSVFLMIIPHKRDFDFVIIHGAGLLGGDKVSKLLADRLDKAIEIYRKDPTPPYMIPSGGKGGDETVSEAEAMAEYLRWHDIPDEKIILEDKSRTTYENLQNSKEIIESMGGRAYTTLVTSNYHVYRALRYCRKIGLKCTGVGSHVAFYYWPSALIREWIAIHAEKKHAILFLAGWIIPLILLMGF